MEGESNETLTTEEDPYGELPGSSPRTARQPRRGDENDADSDPDEKPRHRANPEPARQSRHDPAAFASQARGILAAKVKTRSRRVVGMRAARRGAPVSNLPLGLSLLHVSARGRHVRASMLTCDVKEDTWA